MLPANAQNSASVETECTDLR